MSGKSHGGTQAPPLAEHVTEALNNLKDSAFAARDFVGMGTEAEKTFKERFAQVTIDLSTKEKLSLLNHINTKDVSHTVDGERVKNVFGPLRDTVTKPMQLEQGARLVKESQMEANLRTGVKTLKVKEQMAEVSSQLKRVLPAAQALHERVTALERTTGADQKKEDGPQASPPKKLSLLTRALNWVKTKLGFKPKEAKPMEAMSPADISSLTGTLAKKQPRQSHNRAAEQSLDQAPSNAQDHPAKAIRTSFDRQSPRHASTAVVTGHAQTRGKQSSGI